MKIFTILFLLVFFTSLGFSYHTYNISVNVSGSSPCSLNGVVSSETGNNLQNYTNTNWAYGCQLQTSITANYAVISISSYVIGTGTQWYPSFSCPIFDTGNKSGSGSGLLVSPSPQIVLGLPAVASYSYSWTRDDFESKPVWIGSPQTGQTILQGQTKYIDISSFSPACTDYSLTSSGGQVSRIGSILSVSASASTTSISGSFKGLKDGVWSDDVPFSFTVLKSSVITPLVINENGINPNDTFDSDIGASNYQFKDALTNGSTFNQSSTGSTVNTSNLPNGTKILASAYDSQGNLVQQKVVTVLNNPIPSTAINSNSVQSNSATSINSISGSSITHKVEAKGAINGVIYQLDPNASTSKWLSINPQTGVVTGTPPAGTSEYKFDVMKTVYDPNKDLPSHQMETIYGTVSPSGSPVVPNTQIASDSLNAISSVNQSITNQTQVFNNMSSLLQSISTNTSTGGSADMSGVIEAVNSLKDNSGVPDLNKEYNLSSIPDSADITAPSSVTSALNVRYSSSAPVMTIPLSLCNYGGLNMNDYVIDFSSPLLTTIVTTIRLFLLGACALYFALQTIKLFRTFEY